MTSYNWNHWGRSSQIAVLILFFSTVAIWTYTYQIYRKYKAPGFKKSVFQTLIDRYERGEITHEEYCKMKSDYYIKNPRPQLLHGKTFK